MSWVVEPPFPRPMSLNSPADEPARQTEDGNCGRWGSIARDRLLIAISGLTSPLLTDASVSTSSDGHCIVARRALEAFDRHEAPPAEWIQDRTASAEAVRTCDRN